MDDPGYILEHSEAEHRRLQLQATWLEPITIRLLNSAGLKGGMSVLDIGTGAGDVAMLAGRLAGPAGQVVGTDIDAGVVELARQRAAAAGLRNVTFERRSAGDPGGLRQFDLVVCRLVAVHQPDRVGFIRKAAASVAPGGVLCMIEPAYEMTGPWSLPVVPEYDNIVRWQLQTFASAAVTSVGFGFVDLFAKAGLGEPSLMAEIPTGGPSSSILDWMVLTLGTLMHVIERNGIATPAEVGIDTLKERAHRAVVSASAQLRTWAVAGAWAIVDGS